VRPATITKFLRDTSRSARAPRYVLLVTVIVDAGSRLLRTTVSRVISEATLKIPAARSLVNVIALHTMASRSMSMKRASLEA
jgi:hypothetical protein